MTSYENELAAERRVKMRRALTALAVIMVLAGVAYGVYSITLGRQVLRGETTLDFGILEFDTYGKTVTGQFELVNSLSEPLTIARVVPTCGCTAVDPGPWTIGPGEQWVLPVEFTLSKTGLKHADIRVVLEGRGAQTLRVQGIGRDTRMLTSPHANGFVLRPGLPSIISIQAGVYDSQDPPPALEVAEAPENVTAKIIGWERNNVQRRGEFEPVRWVTKVEIRQDGGDPIEDQPITFRASGTEQSITIRINGEIPTIAVDGPAPNR